MHPGAFIPRSLALKDGVSVMLRRIALDDADAVLDLERACVRDGRGVVRDLVDLPTDERAMRKFLRPWIDDGERAGVNGCMLVIVPQEELAELPRVLGVGHLRRLRPAKVRHVAQVSLEVHPLAQARGVGRAIMLGLLDWARAVGINRAQLNVLADNARAIALYESLGFERTGLRRRFIRDPDGRERDDLEMGLLLDEATPTD